MIRHLAHCEKAALLTVYKFGNYNGLDKIFRILRGSGKRMKSTRFWISCVALSTLLLGLSVAQDNSNTKNSKGAKAAPAKETVAKPLSEKEKKRREAKLRKELETPYRKWLNEDVVYIITDEERAAFKKLQTDEEREQFIEQFWLRRDPTPDSVENEFKEEHYRRIAYANEHYASGIPGWKTD